MIFDEIKPGEKFSLHKESKGKLRGVMTVSKVAEKTVGQNNPMDFVVVNYGAGEAPHRAKMVLRRACIFNLDVCIGEENEEMTESERYYKRWKYLRDNGVPTLGSMRIVDDDRVALGDATADGSEFFGKARVRISEGEKRRDEKRRSLTKKEEVFVEIYENGELEKEVRRVAELMRKANLDFPHDDYFDTIIHNDGSFDVLVMDLSALDKSEGTALPIDLMRMPERLYNAIMAIKK